MIELRREENRAGPAVTGFAPDGFKIGDTVFDQALLLTPDKAQSSDLTELSSLDAEAVIDALEMQPEPEFLLLGSGGAMQMPDASFRARLDERSIGLEVMDSKAAARIWGVLRGEERWIGALLLPF